MKHREEYVHPIWPNVDEDEIHLNVMKAFRGTYLVTSSTLIEVFNVTYHNADMTRWTALVSTTTILGVIDYYEIYFNGTNSIFVM